MSTQPTILAPAPPAGRFLVFALAPGADPRHRVRRSMPDARWAQRMCPSSDRTS
jgi:hypothetical protein